VRKTEVSLQKMSQELLEREQDGVAAPVDTDADFALSLGIEEDEFVPDDFDEVLGEDPGFAAAAAPPASAGRVRGVFFFFFFFFFFSSRLFFSCFFFSF
jgi:hypothetical protein